MKTVPLAVGCMIAALTVQADWPQYQGPDRNGISRETGLAKTWPAGGPKVLWKTELGMGYSSPAIKDGEIYLLDRTGEEEVAARKDVLRCFDLQNGKEKWSQAYNAPGKHGHDGSRCAPTVTDTHVFTVGPFGDIYCFDRKSRKPVWNVNLVKDLSGQKPGWGIGQSPLIYKDWVIVAVQSSDIGLAAFEQATGKIAWQSEPLGGASYVSPALAVIDGQDQLLMSSAAGKKGPKGMTCGIAAETGEVLWKYDGWQCQIPIPFPTHLGDGKILITGGYEAGSVMIQVKNAKVKELFADKTFGSQLQQPLPAGGHIFFDNNENKRRDGLACMTMDGKLVWKTKDIENGPKFDRGNLLLADGMIYAVDAVGNLKMIRPDPKGYSEVASAHLLDGKEIWSPMALSGGKLVLRDQSKMICIDLARP